jgi:DNA-damage-inducible protein J
MAIIQLRVSDQLKDEATELYNKLGLDLSSAIRMFLARSVGVKGIPFPMMVDEPNPVIADEAVKVMRECQEISQKNGNDKMTLDEINEEIRLAREERKKKS